nr:heme-binding protein [Lactobacillus sp. HBUAS51381]
MAMNEAQLTALVQAVLARKANLFSLTKMETVIAAAVKRASELDVGVTIAIMRNDQVVQMSYHMPNANLVSSQLAPKKAWSALAMQQSTIDLSQQVQPGEELYQIETMMTGQLTSFGGGIPLEVDGEVIGAIGVSGGTVAQDQEICEVAVKTFMKESR